MKPVFYNNVEFKQILERVEKLIREAEMSSDEESKELTASILKYFDLLHREPLARIIKMIESSHPEMRDRMKQDFTIKTLLDLYDFNNEKLE